MALNESDGPSVPFSKARKITDKLDIEKLNYPIKIEFLTENFYNTFSSSIQQIYLVEDELFDLETIKLNLVIAKNSYGRLTLGTNVVSQSKVVIKCFYKWKLAKWEDDDLFHKLALGITKFKQEDGIVELLRASTTPTFLLLVFKFYRYNSIYYHIRRMNKFSEETALYFLRLIVHTMLNFHKNNKILLGLRSDHVYIDDKGQPRIQIFNSFKFNAYNLQNDKISDEVSYYCK